ncbi:MAG: hypothetical protein ACYS6K_14340 [Planctomycetota bacterium]|jgi:hypothetical protein
MYRRLFQTNHLVTTLVVLLLLAAPGAFFAFADEIKINITAKVTDIYDPDQILPIFPDDEITGTIIYESTTPDLMSSDPDIGFYDIHILPTTPYGITLSHPSSGQSFQTSRPYGWFYWVIWNGVSDSIYLESFLESDVGEFYLMLFFDDSSGAALSSDELPARAPVLSDFGMCELCLQDFDSGIEIVCDVTALTTPTPVLSVDIDIKPGSYPNSINLGSNGKVPVAILSSDTFAATELVDPTSVTLAGAEVQVRGKAETPMASDADVNGDGLLDLVVHVSTQALELSAVDTLAVLEGQLFDGTPIGGEDTIRVVPPQ